MTPEIILVLAVLVAVILMFVFEWVRVDVVGIIMMVVLPLLGLVTPKEAISGLSSNAVVSIIAVIIIGSGLDKTGAMNVMSRIILSLAGKSESRVTILISSTVAVISSFMQNIGAAALFLPAARRIGRQIGVPVSRILLPMGFCAIIGGCLTLIGSSPLILMNDVMEIFDPNVEHFGLFSVTPIGIALVIGALIYFVVFGRLVLPSVKGEETGGPMSEILKNTYEDMGTLFELHIPEDYSGPRTLEELSLRPIYFSNVVAVSHNALNEKNFAPKRETEINPGDDIAVIGTHEYISKLADDFGFIVREDMSTFAEELSPNNAGILEGIITPRSELAEKTLRDFEFRKHYQVNPLAIYRRQEVLVANISDIVLHPGDALLLHGRWEHFQVLKEKPDLVFTEQVQGEVLRTDKLKYAVGWLLVSLVMIMGFRVQLSISLLTGALGMILSKVMSIDEAYDAVDWMTVFLLGGLIPLGIAFENTGAANYIATSIMEAAGDVSPIVLLTIIAVLTSFFTLVASNVGAAVLMIPLAMNMAAGAGADPRMAALVVGVACSNTFVLPTHQVNALIMRPGGYRTVDYFRAGTGMTVLYLIIMMAAIYFLYGI
ncbi:MAG: SLC13 family permease [Desulfurivibrionaceae bacterium]